MIVSQSDALFKISRCFDKFKNYILFFLFIIIFCLQIKYYKLSMKKNLRKIHLNLLDNIKHQSSDKDAQITG